MKQIDNTNTVTERPLFPKGRPHLIAIAKTVDAERAASRMLSHAGIDPSKTRFIDAAKNGCTVAEIEKTITSDTEVVVVWNLPALVRYKVQSFRRVVKMMKELQRLTHDRRIAVIGMTKATNFKYPIDREHVAGTNIWTRLARPLRLSIPDQHRTRLQCFSVARITNGGNLSWLCCRETDRKQWQSGLKSPTRALLTGANVHVKRYR